jgi:cell division septum initiation protein DivIVA
MIDLDAIERRANAATPGPWTYHEGCGYVEVPPCGAIEFKPGWERSVHFLARVHNNHVEGEDGLGFDGAFIAAARTDVPQLVARVRELEDHTACLEALLREKTEEADELDDERREAWAHIHEHASARSHAILRAIHGALTDALPSTPIPALDSFDVVEMVRNIVAERDQALADYQDLGRVMHEECARLEAECERMKTFAAKSFSQMICQEVEQMREYGLSYEGVSKVLHEYNDGEISFGKLMDLIRAAARAMAEDMQNE